MITLKKGLCPSCVSPLNSVQLERPCKASSPKDYVMQSATGEASQAFSPPRPRLYSADPCIPCGNLTRRIHKSAKLEERTDTTRMDTEMPKLTNLNGQCFAAMQTTRTKDDSKQGKKSHEKYSKRSEETFESEFDTPGHLNSPEGTAKKVCPCLLPNRAAECPELVEMRRQSCWKEDVAPDQVSGRQKRKISSTKEEITGFAGPLSREIEISKHVYTIRGSIELFELKLLESWGGTSFDSVQTAIYATVKRAGYWTEKCFFEASKVFWGLNKELEDSVLMGHCDEALEIFKTNVMYAFDVFEREFMRFCCQTLFPMMDLKREDVLRATFSGGPRPITLGGTTRKTQFEALLKAIVKLKVLPES